MKYVPIPVQMLAIGHPLPVDVWSANGQLLLKKGQPVLSEDHREKLHAFDASTTPSDALAWQRAYERMVHAMLRDGVDIAEIANAPMPSEIAEVDYVVGQEAVGGWLDVQAVLRGILYQGGLTINPLSRLAGVQSKALALLKQDTDDSLFCLYQALADDSLGYCATHALLCFVACELAAEKLTISTAARQPLRTAALTMNIAMAREQDSMTRQASALTAWQRKLIKEHPAKAVDLIQGFGLNDEDLLDIVRWHHAPDDAEALPRNHLSRQLLSLADGFVAQTAARKTRLARSAVKAVKAMVLGAEGPAIGVSSALAQAVGFYPPGTYVELLNGEIAVSVQRGLRANTPWVIPIVDKDGIPIARYVCRDSSETTYNPRTAVTFDKIKVTVNAEKVRRARERIPR